VIDVVTVGARDTVDTLARRMAYTTYQTERFRVLNGLTAGESVQPGQRVKLVVYGTPTALRSIGAIEKGDGPLSAALSCITSASRQ
jgi:hypothetical protein